MVKKRQRLIYFVLAALLMVAGFSLPRSFDAHARAAHAATTTMQVLFDGNHAETAGNADWIISTSMPDPLQQNPNPQVETDWTGGISAWGVALQKTGRYSLKTNNAAFTYGDSTNPLDLRNFNELVLPEPNTLFTSSEKTAILTFVHNGGGLFMIADHTGSDRNNDGSDSLKIFNDLMDNNGIGNDLFGIQYDALNIVKENPNNDTPNASTDPILNGPFGTATASIIRNGTTETLAPGDNPNVQGDIYRSGFSNTGTTGVFVSHSTYGSGRVVAQGDSSAIDDGTCEGSKRCFDGWDDPAGQDAALFPNATEWLAGGNSNPTPTPTTTTTATPPPTPSPTSTPPPTPTMTPPPTPGPTSTPPPTPTPTPTPTPMPSPTPTPGPGNLISNGGFENGTSPWVESSSGGYELIDSSNPHTGANSAHLCGYNNCQDSIAQSVTIPANVTSAKLSYYWYMATQETSSKVYDDLYVRVLNSSGSTLGTLQTITNGSTAHSWTSASFDVSAYKGQTIQIAFVATNDYVKPTDFYTDDVALNAQ